MDLSKENLFFEAWTQAEAVATNMLAYLNDLRIQRGVLIHVYGRSISKVTSVEVIKVHRYAKLITGEDLTVQETFPVLVALSKLDLSPCRLDLGKLTYRFKNSGLSSVDEYLARELKEVCSGMQPVLAKPQDLVFYGFGRIGRLLTRIMIDKVGKGDKIRPRAIVVRKSGKDDLEKRAALLRYDSIHGKFSGTIEIDTEENAIIANGNLLRLIDAGNPEEIDYTKYGIKDAILVDNTGKLTDREGLSRHLKAPGVKKVILSAPGKGDVPNIVYGINNNTLDPNEGVVSAASCTTNAIAPVLKVVHEKYGIVSGHIESVHSYTNDQNLIDNFHKKARRGRAAALNMVITSTGAAGAVSKVLPQLKGKMTGNAIRVPTPNVSLAILKLTLEKPTSKDELNDFFRLISLNSPLQNQIDYVYSHEIASSDIIGSRHAGVVDGEATLVNEADPRNIVLYVWYDNEYGYTCQLMRVIQQMAGLNLPDLPRV